jgi:hypothetical protein
MAVTSGITFIMVINAHRRRGANAPLLSCWIALERLFIPLPSIAIGTSVGVAVSGLASTPDGRMTVLTLGCLVLWLWNVTQVVRLDAASAGPRPSDHLQVRPPHIGFALWFYLLPVVCSALPWLIDRIVPRRGLGEFASFAAIAVVNASVFLKIVKSRPFAKSLMNCVLATVCVQTVPVAALTFYEERRFTGFTFVGTSAVALAITWPFAKR